MNSSGRARIEEICNHQIAHFRRLIEHIERGDMTTRDVKDGKAQDTTKDTQAFFYQLIADLERTLATLREKSD
jgi:hypothetical protein